MTLVASSPASFTLSRVSIPSPSSYTALTFSIPAGTYQSAYWQIDGTVTSSFVYLASGFYFDTANSNNNVWDYTLPGGTTSPYDLSVADGYAGPGSLQNPGFSILATILPGIALSLAQINAAAGTSLTIYIGWQGDAAGSTLAVSRCSLYLIPASTGGSPVSFTTASQNNSNGCSTITIQLVDGSGNAALAPLGGQVFTASTTCSGGNFNPYVLTIPQGSSNGTITYCNQNSGMCQVKVCPGAGPLAAVSCQTFNVTISGAPTDPETAVCQITRPLMREAIRHNLGIVTPLDGGLGNAGDEPLGQRWPTTVVLNDKISDAIRLINVKARLHSIVGLTIPVGAYGATYQGPAIVSLAGDVNCPTRLSLNNVKRVVYTDTAGNIYRLRATSYYDHDKNLRSWDATYPAMAPQEFATEAYALLIWPAPLIAGTLTLYAGTSFPNFANDNDWLDQLPFDYQLVIEHIATMLVCMTRLNEPNWLQMYKTYKELGEDGIKEIKQWHATFNQSYTTQLVPDKGRRRRVR